MLKTMTGVRTNPGPNLHLLTRSGSPLPPSGDRYKISSVWTYVNCSCIKQMHIIGLFLNVVILLIVYCFILLHFGIFICEKCSINKLYLLT